MTAVSLNAQAEGLRGPEAWQQLALMHQIKGKTSAHVAVFVSLKVHAPMHQFSTVLEAGKVFTAF